MKVYRLEHPQLHLGPHTAVTCDVDTQAAWDLVDQEPAMQVDNRPGPSKDLGFGWNWKAELCKRFCCTYKDIKFGCESLEALQKWFGGELFELLLDAGHVIRIYDVPEKFVYKGGKQLAFRFMDDFE